MTKYHLPAANNFHLKSYFPNGTFNMLTCPFGIFSFLLTIYTTTEKMKKALREMQTLCAGCSKAEPNFFAPPQTPFPGAQDGQNFISWRWSLPSPTDPV